MATVTADDAPPPNWPDLPSDLLRDVSSRLHAAADYARFHAACQPWRDTLPPAPRRPTFLPWLLSPPDATGHRKARCVLSFSSSNSGRRSTTAEILVRDRRWVISAADDGRAIGWITTAAAAACPEHRSCVVDPLTGASAAAIPLPRYLDEMKSWEKRASGVVSGDGTIVVYAYDPVVTSPLAGSSFDVALLRPGSDAAWTFVRRKYVSMFCVWDRRCCVAYRHRHGMMVVCIENKWWLLPMQENAAVNGGSRLREWMPDEPRKSFVSGYLVESQGELLWACVHQCDIEHCRDLKHHGGVGDAMESLTGTLSVSVYMLIKEEEGSKAEWVKKDQQSLADRVLFLGRPTSFAIDAARLGISGGCAYFVSKLTALERCRLFRYSFQDGRSELVEQLPEGWNDGNCMWLTPQPALAPTEEIRGRLSHRQFGTYFRIYVGNLSHKVDNYQLGQFFSRHGNVADASVVCKKVTGRSRGFGFVTMATHVGDEPADAIARLHGQILDGRMLQVKFAHRERNSNLVWRS